MEAADRVRPWAAVVTLLLLAATAGVVSASTSPKSASRTPKTHQARTITSEAATSTSVPSIPERIPTNPPTVTNIPPEPCINHDLEASVMDTGIDSMQEYQDIVTVTSAVPCRVDGYPSVALSDTQSQTTVIDGGTFGRSNPPMVVAVGPGEPASFVIQVPQNVTGCPVAKLYIGLPGTDPRVLVTVAPVIGDGSWPTCGSLRVSAFEQGNDPGQYIG